MLRRDYLKASCLAGPSMVSGCSQISLEQKESESLDRIELETFDRLDMSDSGIINPESEDDGQHSVLLLNRREEKVEFDSFVFYSDGEKNVYRSSGIMDGMSYSLYRLNRRDEYSLQLTLPTGPVLTENVPRVAFDTKNSVSVFEFTTNEVVSRTGRNESSLKT